MKTATLVTAKVQHVNIHPYQDYLEVRTFSRQEPETLVDPSNGDFAMPLPGETFGHIDKFPIKRFCISKIPDRYDRLDIRPSAIPRDEIEHHEWYVAMDPLIQECFDAELNTVRQDAQHKNWLYQQEKERTLHLESELERIHSMTAWETLKVAMAKLWGGNHD